jgi:UDPglucose 6-dehydrogenase
MYWSRICGGPTYGSNSAKMSHIQVTVVDLNEERIAAWNDENVNNIPIYEPGLRKLLLKREEETCFLLRLKSNRRSASYFISVNNPNQNLWKRERNGS